MLEFSNSPAINYDIVFAILSKGDLFISPPEKQIVPSELSTHLTPGDSPSNVAFFQDQPSIIRSKRSYKAPFPTIILQP